MSLGGVIPVAPNVQSDRLIALPHLLGVMSTFVLLFTIAFACVYFDGVTYRTVLISADAAVLLAPVTLRFLRGTFDVFEPILMAVLAQAGMMIGRPMADMMTGNHFEHAYDIGPSYNAALLLVLMSNLAFILGYELNIGRALVRNLPKLPTYFNESVAARWALFISVLGCLVFSIFLTSNGGLLFFLKLSHGRTGVEGPNPYNATNAYISNAIGLLVPGCYILFALWMRRRRIVFLLMSAAVITPYLVLMVGGGARSGVIPVLFGLPALWYLYHRSRPSLALIASCGLVIGFIFSVQRDSRAEADSAHGQALNQALANPVITVLNLFRSDDDEMFDVVAQELEVIPHWVPYAHGSVLSDIVIRAIPKNLFPNGKPKEAGVIFFTAMEPGRAKFSGAGTACSLIGSFYMDSGAGTAIFYMFIMGMVLSAAWAYFLANQRSMIMVIAFAIVPADVLGAARGDVVTLISTIPFSVLPVFLLFLLQRLRLTSRETPMFGISA